MHDKVTRMAVRKLYIILIILCFGCTKRDRDIPFYYTEDRPSTEFGEDKISTMVQYNNYLYVLKYEQLYCYDNSNPDMPKLQNTIVMNTIVDDRTQRFLGSYVGIVLKDTFLCILGTQGSDLFSLQNPIKPKFKGIAYGSYQSTQTHNSFDISRNIMAISTNLRTDEINGRRFDGIYLNYWQNTFFTLSKFYNLPNAGSLAFKDSTLYVGRAELGFTIINASDTSKLARIDSVTNITVRKLKVIDNTLLVYTNNTLLQYNIKDSERPVFIRKNEL